MQGAAPPMESTGRGGHTATFALASVPTLQSFATRYRNTP